MNVTFLLEEFGDVDVGSWDGRAFSLLSPLISVNDFTHRWFQYEFYNIWYTLLCDYTRYFMLPIFIAFLSNLFFFFERLHKLMEDLNDDCQRPWRFLLFRLWRGISLQSPSEFCWSLILSKVFGRSISSPIIPSKDSTGSQNE